MNFLSKLFQKQTGWLRGLKASYLLNNLLHFRQLARNREIYKRLGLRKSIFASIGYADVKDLPSKEEPWLDKPNALEQLIAHPEYSRFPEHIQIELRRFVTDGYMIIQGIVTNEQIDQLNTEVEQYLHGGAIDFNYTGRKIIDLHQHSDIAREQFFRNPVLLRLFKFILQKEIIPFQSLNFIQGSEQKVHSDSIHMMTEPPGFMIAAWFALEDCTPDNGPLVYYPCSHRWPYITTLDYPSGNTRYMLGEDSNQRYEEHIAQLVAASEIKPAYFLAPKGSVLVWHANLLHGGSPIKQPGATRKSMVCHYYSSEVICYHEMSQRPAILPAK